MITKALELGFGQDFQKESEAHELLAEIHDVAGENEQANCARKKQLASLQAWIAKGIPIDFNQRANAYAHMAGVCEQLGQTDQAAEYQLLAQENRDGFTLLNEALEELRSLEGRIEKETGAKILDKLSKAAGRIPEKFPERHAEVYRATGEILEAWGDTEQAVEYFEYALQKNPKVGVKRRLESLKKTT